MNKLYYLALALGLTFSLNQAPSFAQAWADTTPQPPGPQAPFAQPTWNGGGQQTSITSQQTVPLPPVYQGGMAQGSAAGLGTVPYGGYTFGFTGGGASGNGGYSGLPPTSLGSCNGISITSGAGGGLFGASVAGQTSVNIQGSGTNTTYTFTNPTVPGTSVTTNTSGQIINANP